MRTKKLDKKLSLMKVTVSRLSDTTLGRVNGGDPDQEALRTRYTGCNKELENDDLLVSVISPCV
jgi:hypothetical protein